MNAILLLKQIERTTTCAVVDFDGLCVGAKLLLNACSPYSLGWFGYTQPTYCTYIEVMQTRLKKDNHALPWSSRFGGNSQNFINFNIKWLNATREMCLW